MKEPILQDKRNEHLKFCKYSIELLERVKGVKSDSFETSLGNLSKVILFFMFCFVLILCFGLKKILFHFYLK